MDKFRHWRDKYHGNRYVKHFTCWNQLLAMMLGQLSNRESLGDLIVSLETHRAEFYHQGIGSKPTVCTTFAKAYQVLGYRIFEGFAFYMMDLARRKRVVEIFRLGGNVYAFGSTAIPLCLSVCCWAKSRKRKGGVKAHSLYDMETSVLAFFHVTTALVHDSKTARFIPCESDYYYVLDRDSKSLMPWASKCLTQELMDMWIISVWRLIRSEVWSVDFRCTVRHRMRYAWLLLRRKPSFSCRRCWSVNCIIFIFAIAVSICGYNVQAYAKM